MSYWNNSCILKPNDSIINYINISTCVSYRIQCATKDSRFIKIIIVYRIRAKQTWERKKKSIFFPQSKYPQEESILIY